MLQLGSKFIECVLCHGALPPNCDEVFYKHMNDQHRVFFNIQLVFKLSSLANSQLSKIEKLVEDNAESHEELIDKLDRKVPTPDIKEEAAKPNLHLPDKIEDNDSFNTFDFLNVKESALKKEEEEKVLKSVPKLFTKQETKCNCGCDKVFESQTAMLSHIRVELRGHKQCEYCKKAFKKDKYYQKHLVKSHSKALQKNSSSDSNICEECGTSFKNKHYAMYHIKFCHDKDNFLCDICNEQIQGYRRLKLHQRRAHREPKECKECNKTFRDLHRHKKIVHTDDKDKKYQCQICDKGFVEKTKLNDHIVIHNDARPFQCKFCQFSSKTKHNRDLHENQVHNTDKNHGK